MPEYLAPGVYIEETSFRSKSIEGVSTTTTGFIGPCRFGPVHLEPDVITGLEEFGRIYRDGERLSYDDGLELHNYLWHAVRAFFTEGGKRLYVSRVFQRLDEEPYSPDELSETMDGSGDFYVDGHGRIALGDGNLIKIRSRFPGALGNLKLQFSLKAGLNVLGVEEDAANPGQQKPTLVSINLHDVVFVQDLTSPLGSPPEGGGFYLVEQDGVSGEWELRPLQTSPSSSPRKLKELIPSPEPGQGDSVRVVTAGVSVFSDRGEELGSWSDLPLDPRHESFGIKDSLFERFRTEPSSLREARELPVVFELSEITANGLEVLSALFSETLQNDFPLTDKERAKELTQADKLSSGLSRRELVELEGGNDGKRPGLTEYEGDADFRKSFKTGLKQFEDIEDISIVAAPGVTANYKDAYVTTANAIIGILNNHAERMRYRIAVLDSAEGHSIAEVRGMRAKLDSKYAALYYPWVKVLDPITRKEIALPPSGFVAGIYARNDINRAVWKAPANEVVNLALGFETMLNKAQQDVLNPEGINCFRFFEGRGMLLWGARTISSDPEWKYVNLRRYFAYLERSIDKGTQWAVFEPNGNLLWDNVRRTIDDFLFNEWQMGALLGEKPEKAYFVKCDRTTMTQNDLDNGRLVCLIGVAVVKPAEYVIFRIGQWTGDRR